MVICLRSPRCHKSGSLAVRGLGGTKRLLIRQSWFGIKNNSQPNQIHLPTIEGSIECEFIFIPALCGSQKNSLAPPFWPALVVTDKGDRFMRTVSHLEQMGHQRKV
ncbi:hypothetical protein VFPPC_15984 [Pochonia chlamydosporia 170]|uniref:Uncharacterized protein n=1 Tax=Pochonia chlamydosporia 170 TaxID=1380566 RepID=A0A179FL98_METCM|nr:hypothetical protein VFPPC_15984 [Pochonia chlamydosporia 170]OAQ66118.1 hypothetical protein VFPPC_15984 [Pochonia chlamydosporia 170]